MIAPNISKQIISLVKTQETPSLNWTTIPEYYTLATLILDKPTTSVALKSVAPYNTRPFHPG